MTYKVTVDTSSAKSQARNVRAAFEAELRSIKVGQLDTSGLKSATSQAKLLTAEMERAAKAGDLGQLDTSGLQRASSEAGRLRHELEQAGQAATHINVPTIGAGAGGAGLGGLAGGLLGGFAVGAVIGQLRELGQALEQTARRGAIYTQLGDVLNVYTKSVGSSTAAFISAGQKASQGTIAQYDLILNANRAIQFEVAKTSDQYAKLIELSTALGRAQGISDSQALEFLTTGLARESRLILDNLGLIINVEAATEKYAATLGKTADELTAAERKTALLNEAFLQGATALEANRAASESTATAIERYDANVQNLKDSFGRLTAEILNVPINRLAEIMGVAVDFSDDGQLGPDSLTQIIEKRKKAIEQAQKDIAALKPNQTRDTLFGEMPDLGVVNRIGELNGEIIEHRQVIEDTTAALRDATIAQDGLNNAQQQASYSLRTADMQGALAQQQEIDKKRAAAAAALASEKLAQDQQTSIDKALASRAEKAVETLGADRALELYQQAKADAETAIQALVEAGVTDATEFGLRTEEILLGLTKSFDVVNQVDFSALSTAFSSLDTGFVDFLPGMEAARTELASLSEEIAYTGTATDEQAARLEYLTAAAYAVANSTSQLGAVTAELGYEFLASNEYAAALVDQLYQAEAAYRNGQISADIYAGITAALSGRLLGLAQSAGIATGAIYALNSAQADMASAGGLAIGGSIANRVQADQGAKAREHNRRELDRYAKDQARAGEQSAKRAGKSLEDSAKKAGKELESALRGVEGLFDASKVTDEDLKKAQAGNYTDKADEYLRRLRDEVENGVDWADVSIDDAKAALEKVGLRAGESAKEILANFEEAWNSSALFSDKANLSFINEEAVKLQQDLSDKAAQGEKNILEYFGVVVDDAVSAATGGGGSAIEIRPPDLIDVDPITAGLQTGLDDAIAKTAEKVKQAFVSAGDVGDPIYSFGGTGKPTGVMGPFPKQINVVADPTVTTLVPYLTPAAAPATVAPVLQPTIDATAFQAELDKITASVAVTLYTTIEEIQLYKGIVAATVKPSVSPTLFLTDAAIFEYEATAAAKVAPSIVPTMSFSATDASDFAVLLEDTIPAPSVGTVLYTSIEEIQLFKSIVEATVKPTISVTLAVTTTEGSDAITPLITDLNTQIRAKQPLIADQGITIGQMLVAGMIAHFKGGQSAASAASGESASPFADALMTNLSTQFTTTQNMFYAIGFLPAMGVESGFKAYAYDGLATSFMEKFTAEIRSNADALGQRGGTMAGYVQSGFVSAFNSESFKAQLTAIGDMMYTYIEIGILARVNGGALTEAIATKVIEDLAAEVEK